MDDKPTNRRALLGVVSGMAAVIAACGKTDFATRTVTKKAPPANAPATAFELPPQETNPVNLPTTPPPLPNQSDSCGLNPKGLGKTSDVTAELNMIFNSVLYGDKIGSTMLAIKFNAVDPGSEVILSMSSPEGSTIIARRLLLGDGVVFDHLNLSGPDKIDVLVVKGASKRRQEVTVKDADYQKVFNNKPVVQPWFAGSAQTDYFGNTFKGHMTPAEVDAIATGAKQLGGDALNRKLQTSGWADVFDGSPLFTDIFGVAVASPSAMLASRNQFVAFAPVTIAGVPKYVRQIFTFG